jgi:TolB-like protein
MVILAVVAAAVVAALVGWRLWDRATPGREPTVAVSDFKAVNRDPADLALAAGLSDDLAGVLGEHAVGSEAPAQAPARRWDPTSG